MKWTAFLLLLVCLLCLFQGPLPFEQLFWHAVERLLGKHTFWNPLLDERIPRLIVLLCSGASLSVSGAVLQAIFQNPLASPSLLGITPAGSLAILCTLIFNFHTSFPAFLPLSAFFGCLIALSFVFLLSRSSLYHLIISGICLSTIFSAIQGALIFSLRYDWNLMQLITEWEAGVSIEKTWQHVYLQLPLTLIGLYGCWHFRKEIDLLSLGEIEAKILGVEVEALRWQLFIFIALLSAGVLAGMGIIPFFGLLIPHLFRHLIGYKMDRLIPYCILGGSLSLCILHLLLTLPILNKYSVGTLSSLLGGILLLFLMLKKTDNYARSY